MGRTTRKKDSGPAERRHGPVGRNAEDSTSWCRYHCPTCEGHFTSLAAFDAHRLGNPSAGSRICADAPGEVRSEQGRRKLIKVVGKTGCKLTKGIDKELEVTLWEAM